MTYHRDPDDRSDSVGCAGLPRHAAGKLCRTWHDLRVPLAHLSYSGSGCVFDIGYRI